MRIFLIFTLCFAFSLATLSADDTEQLAQEKFAKANEYYTQDKYEDAIRLYESLETAGIQSAELYFNIGNCYFKLGKIAESILNFERAKKLDPSDEDIDFNLQISNLKIVDKIEPVPVPFFVDLFRQFENLLNVNAWTWLALALVWLGVVFLAFFVASGRPLIKKLSFAFAIFLIILSFIGAYSRDKKMDSEGIRNEAIIMSPSVYIKSAPEDNATDLFILHEGTKVIISDVIGKWHKIKLLDGNVGWILQSDLEMI